jgi:hypothetical protein
MHRNCTEIRTKFYGASTVFSVGKSAVFHGLGGKIGGRGGEAYFRLEMATAGERDGRATA